GRRARAAGPARAFQRLQAPVQAARVPRLGPAGRPAADQHRLEMKDGVEAMFLSSGTPENIADCCERIFGDPALGARLGKSGAAFARKHFDLETNTQALLKIYQK